MKLSSIEKVDGKHIEATFSLDSELIKGIKYEGDEIYSAEYVVEFGDPTGLPYNASEITFYVKVTGNDVYASVNTQLTTDEEYLEYSEYSPNSTGIDYNVTFEPHEKIMFLISLLRSIRTQ